MELLPTPEPDPDNLLEGPEWDALVAAVVEAEVLERAEDELAA
jgi:hypothetical protein